MKLNLSAKGEVSVDDSILMDELSSKTQKACDEFIVQLVDGNSLCELDLLLSVISRNPLQSQLLPIINRLTLLQKKLEQGDDISLIVTDDRAMLGPIGKILDKFDQEIPVKIKRGEGHRPLVFGMLLRLIQSIYLIFISWLWPRLARMYRENPKDSVVFVDTFVIPGIFTEEGEFIDRYYTGYDQQLNDVQNRAICYAPVLVGHKTLKTCLKMASLSKKNKHNFLF